MSYQLEREEQYLEEMLNSGEITLAEFNKEMRELQREYWAAAEETAWNAYENEMGRW